MLLQKIHRLGWHIKGSLVLAALILFASMVSVIASAPMTISHPEDRSADVESGRPPDAGLDHDGTSTAGESQSITHLCEFPLVAETESDDQVAGGSGMRSVAPPRIAVTYEHGIGISSWNRAGDQLLLYRVGPKPGRQTIDLLNTKTDELTTIAEGALGDRSTPKWLGPSELVVYWDQNTEGVFRLQVLDLTSKSDSLAVESDRSWVGVEFDSSSMTEDMFFLGANDALMAYSAASRSVASIDGLGSATLPTPGPRDWPFFQFAISPDGLHAVASGSMGTFWFSRDGTPACRIDLVPLLGPSGSLSGVKFSPSGQYLAGRSQSPGGGDHWTPGPFALLDLWTGKGFSLPIAKGIGVNGFAWSPDSRSIVALVYLGNETGVSRESLVMVDIVNGESIRQLEGTEFVSGGIWGMAWNPNGEEIAFACLAHDESGRYFGQLCIAPVEDVD